MNFAEAIKLAFAAINAHRLRSTLTTLGIIIGVLTVIGMLALIDGLNKMVSEQLSTVGSSTLFIQKTAFTMNRSEMLQSLDRKNLTMEDAEAIATRCPSVQRVSPFLFTISKITYFQDDVEGTQVTGANTEFQYINNYEIASGRQMAEVDMVHSRQVCLIGASVADELFHGRDPVGERIRVGPHRFQIIAVLKPKGSFFGRDQDNMILIPVSTFMKLFSGKIQEHGFESMTIMAQPRTEALVSAAKEEIRDLLRRRRKVPADKPDDFNIVTPDQLLSLYQNITSGIYGLMIGVTGLSLLVGGIGIMNIMLVSVSERIREIGIRKAIGARRRDIRIQFLVEAILLASVGGLIGTALGFVMAWVVSLTIKLPAAVSWWSILLGIGFSALVGVFFGWYPANRAAGMNPIEALRHE